MRNPRGWWWKAFPLLLRVSRGTSYHEWVITIPCDRTNSIFFQNNVEGNHLKKLEMKASPQPSVPVRRCFLTCWVFLEVTSKLISLRSEWDFCRSTLQDTNNNQIKWPSLSPDRSQAALVSARNPSPSPCPQLRLNSGLRELLPAAGVWGLPDWARTAILVAAGHFSPVSALLPLSSPPGLPGSSPAVTLWSTSVFAPWFPTMPSLGIPISTLTIRFWCFSRLWPLHACPEGPAVLPWTCSLCCGLTRWPPSILVAERRKMERREEEKEIKERERETQWCFPQIHSSGRPSVCKYRGSG